jgi:hypothetical protein
MAEIREPNRVKEYLSKSGTHARQYDGTNRRAIALLPEPNGGQSSALPGSDQSNRQRLLLAVEANKTTGCIKVMSNKQKSRGAILVFQGRLLGAMYGSANLQRQLFHNDAYTRLVSELSDPETTVTAYSLPETLAIATGALFHGQFSENQQRGGVREAFSGCLRLLTESSMPGCIMVNDGNNVAILSAFFFGGKIVALYSGREGWLAPSAQEAFQQVAKYQGAKARSAMLQARSMDEVLALTTSLSRHGEENYDAAAAAQMIDPSLRVSEQELAQLKGLDKDGQTSRFVSGRNSKDALLERELFLREHLSHLVNP